MTSTVYQVAVEELEALLSPRVVSRSLQEGLKLLGKSPQTVGYEDLEKILKSQIYRQLQVAMPVTEAKTRIHDMLERIRSLEAEIQKRTEINQVVAVQADMLLELKERLKPFNMYFEWSEVQKLRALIQLLETEQEAKREASKLLADAREQLKIVEQKLEDHLVFQAKEISELEAIFDIVKTLGGAKVRRFESLIGQIRSAQDSQQLAAAEVERARKLAIELRKLMESSVVIDMPSPPAGTTEDASAEPPDLKTQLDPEISARLKQLDLEAEQHDLQALIKEYSVLLQYQPKLEQLIEPLQESLVQQVSVAEELTGLRERLRAAQHSQRETLRQELLEIQAGGNVALQQAVQISLGILETTLPLPQDIRHIHDQLLMPAQARQEGTSKDQPPELKTALSQQAAALEGLAMTLERYRETSSVTAEYQLFQTAVEKLKEAKGQARLDEAALAAARQAELQLQRAVTAGASEGRESQMALLQQLLLELRSLSFPDHLQGQAQALQKQLESEVIQLETALLEQQVLEQREQALKGLKQQLMHVVYEQLTLLTEAARSRGADTLLPRLQEAQQNLQQGNYPDLKQLESELDTIVEQRLSDQLHDLHTLETEAAKYEAVNSQPAEELRKHLEEARQALQSRSLVPLEPAWTLLERLRLDAEQRLASFDPRLEAAMLTFARVSKLNSDEVSSAERTLKHLISQREAFQRVSPAVQAGLEASLGQLEALLEQLNEQYEATQAIAGQLVNAGLLDDLFGGGEAKKSPPANVEHPVASKPQNTVLVERQSNNGELNKWLEQYRQERGVRSIMVLKHGQVLAAYLDVSLDGWHKQQHDFEEQLILLGDELQLGRSKLIIVEMQQHSIIMIYPLPQTCVIVVGNQPAMLSFLIHKLQRDIPFLQGVFESVTQSS